MADGDPPLHSIPTGGVSNVLRGFDTVMVSVGHYPVGSMFTLTWKKLSGSYLALIWRSRS